MLILGQSAKLAVLGTGAGTIIAMLFSRFLAFQIRGHAIRSFDAPAYLLAISVVLTSAVVAASLPTRRAVSVDPMETLRYE
jgi:ABC-type antimicrobial peptide transport system permease subunit